MDKRKLNGGHSTKSKGLDKRKNEYKSVLENALKPDELKNVIQMLYKKSINDFDVPASKILLEYYLGKPKETVETTHNVNNFDIKELFKIDKPKP